MKNKDKKNYLEAFKEMYSRNPTPEELKAFTECMCLKKEKEAKNKNIVH